MRSHAARKRGLYKIGPDWRVGGMPNATERIAVRYKKSDVLGGLPVLFSTDGFA